MVSVFCVLLNEMFEKINFLLNLRQIKSVFIFLFMFLIVYHLLYLLSSVRNERLRLRPKIYLWSHLAKPEDNKCRLPLDIDPWDPSVREYLETDGQRRVVCPHENSTYDWTVTDRKGL